MTDIQSNPVPKKDDRPFYKKKRFLIPAVLIGIGMIGSQLDKKGKIENAITSAANASSTKKDDSNSPEKNKEQLKRELASFDKPYDNSSYQGTIESVQMGLVLYAAYANIIKEGKESTDEENRKLADQLQKKVTVRQVKEFPILRKNYAKVAAEKLWESNIYMTTSGDNNSIVNLTGGLFANNKNIAETQRTLLEIFTQFRFKEIRYRWYKEADEFTYYKIDSPKDSDPVDFTK
jgi:ribosome-binding protein aMBF1 (putative translation factor)